MLICWAGDDPTREGLLDTPERVGHAYEEWFAGYDQEPAQMLERCSRKSPVTSIVLLRTSVSRRSANILWQPIIGVPNATSPIAAW